MTPEELTAQALLNCLIREIAEVREEGGGHLCARLPRTGARLRIRLARPSAGLAPRLDGTTSEFRNGRWRLLSWQGLTALVAEELTVASGQENPEFARQVANSHAAVAALRIHRTRCAIGDHRRDPLSHPARSEGSPCDIESAWRGASAPPPDPRISRYLDSEQALVAGHRFHPAPKARPGAPRDWLRYAPEAGARFPLRFLAVREDLLADAGDVTALDRLGAPEPPPGYRTLPAHPWQLELLAGEPWLREARSTGLVTDLGPGERDVAPTSSVRTVYDPVADVFAKFSLQARLTNCVRVSSWYELAGSVELTKLLAPVLEASQDRYPGAVLLTEPGYSTVAASDKRCYEGLAVIVRDGLASRLNPGVTPLLAASLTEPMTRPEPCWPLPLLSPVANHEISGLLGAAGGALTWWEKYLRLVVPPVLDLLVTHGIALEPHLQNVVVGVDAGGLPAQVFFRDLEGTKLVRDHHAGALAEMAPGVARGLAYDRDRAWNRVLYCLLVNHLDQLAAAIADRSPDPLATETELWEMLRETLAKCAADLGGPPPLRAVIEGAPLPAKANLRVRWSRSADREADYLPLPTPWRHA